MSISLHLDVQDVLISLQHIKVGWKISARTNRQSAFLMRQFHKIQSLIAVNWLPRAHDVQHGL
jgi:hypothetical protein